MNFDLSKYYGYFWFKDITFLVEIQDGDEMIYDEIFIKRIASILNFSKLQKCASNMHQSRKLHRTALHATPFSYLSERYNPSGLIIQK